MQDTQRLRATTTERQIQQVEDDQNAYCMIFFSDKDLLNSPFDQKVISCKDIFHDTFQIQQV